MPSSRCLVTLTDSQLQVLMGRDGRDGRDGATGTAGPRKQEVLDGSSRSLLAADCGTTFIATLIGSGPFYPIIGVPPFPGFWFSMLSYGSAGIYFTPTTGTINDADESGASINIVGLGFLEIETDGTNWFVRTARGAMNGLS